MSECVALEQALSSALRSSPPINHRLNGIYAVKQQRVKVALHGSGGRSVSEALFFCFLPARRSVSGCGRMFAGCSQAETGGRPPPCRPRRGPVSDQARIWPRGTRNDLSQPELDTPYAQLGGKWPAAASLGVDQVDYGASICAGRDLVVGAHFWPNRKEGRFSGCRPGDPLPPLGHRAVLVAARGHSAFSFEAGNEPGQFISDRYSAPC